MADRYRLGAQVDGGEALETANGLLYAARSDFPVMANGAVPYAGGDPRALAATGAEWFAERRRGFTLFARSREEDDAATAAGMGLVIGRYPAMVLRSRLPDPAVPEGVELRAVTDEAAARVYTTVADAAFVSLGMPSGVIGDMGPAGFLAPDTAAFVAFAEGRAVAVASAVVARGIAGIQWVGVLEEARGRGLAVAVTAAAANAGFDLGADCAWLEASHMGEPVYLRMGFEEVFSYRVYLAPAPVEA
jgi:ribosomal protein S18 acetylase RimI-like enzyme